MSEENDLAGKYVSPVARRVDTTTGHVLAFVANEPLYVPPVCRPEMFALGILPADGEVPTELTPEQKEEMPEPIGHDRINKVNAAFTAIVEKNDAGDFTATQIPKVSAVNDLLDFEINSKELKDKWKAFRAEE